MLPLSVIELRVLGCLVEKQMTTPDLYPLTLNSLVTACNQTTNREPVFNLDNKSVMEGLDGLRTDHKLVRIVHSGAGSRVDKYKHVVDERLLLTPSEAAIMAVLMLRGPQTLGELKARTERLFTFDDLNQVDIVLDRLSDPTVSPDPQEYPVRSDAGMLRSATNTADMPDGYARPWPGPLVQRLPRLPGQKEARVAQLLGGPIDLEALAAAPVASTAHAGDGGGSWRERVGALEGEVARLNTELANLRGEFDIFRQQF
jgi:uncharacterized protein